MTMNWIAIGDINDIPLRGARCVRTPTGKIAVFRTAHDEVFAIEDHCPHKGGPLSQGIVHGTAVTCPLHNWVISLETGKALVPTRARCARSPSATTMAHCSSLSRASHWQRRNKNGARGQDHLSLLRRGLRRHCPCGG